MTTRPAHRGVNPAAPAIRAPSVGRPETGPAPEEEPVPIVDEPLRPVRPAG